MLGLKKARNLNLLSDVVFLVRAWQIFLETLLILKITAAIFLQVDPFLKHGLGTHNEILPAADECLSDLLSVADWQWNLRHIRSNSFFFECLDCVECPQVRLLSWILVGFQLKVLRIVSVQFLYYFRSEKFTGLRF